MSGRRKIKTKKPTKKKAKKSKKYKKANIPKAIREQVWLQTLGKVYESKCYISWCDNNIDVFNFHVGHNKPESRGGKLNINNLRPICSRCNHSMSNNYRKIISVFKCYCHFLTPCFGRTVRIG